jgi:phage anti-repressor protein
MLVNARDLHTFLESRQEFTHWVRHRLGKYGFLEEEDYLITLSNRVGDGIGKPRTDYLLSLDTAKEISMLEQNNKGRVIRKYFIECERRLRMAHGALNGEMAEKLKQHAKWLSIRERNARSRQAQVLKSAAEFFKTILSDEYMLAIASEITALITGKRLVDPPEAERFYTIGEIGELCGISTGLVEQIVNELRLKTDEYGMLITSEISESANSKQETTFQYRLKAVGKIRDFIAAMKLKITSDDLPL